MDLIDFINLPILNFNILSDEEFIHLYSHYNCQEIFNFFLDRHFRLLNYWPITLADFDYLSYLGLNPSLYDIFILNYK